ncbi:retinol dehydrogenase 13 [Octopus bimaculoides]|nr:retinol dehydrogenase 13 [Octopus bimaculoides]|eukprot:XP_014771814.1 PREDICTED: retinol dehydrogenase 13-like [Octopus bimaculoides]
MIFLLILVALLVGLLTVIYFVLLDNTKSLQYKSEVRLDGKTVLITGATSGVGKSTAFELATYGARIILACRNRQKAEATCQEIKQETGNDNITVLDLDLSDLDSVKSAAEEVKKTESRLDILINNAAIGVTDNERSKQGFDLTFATNYLGHFLLTHLLLDLIKKSAPSRIINVSSKVHEFAPSPLDFTLHREGSDIKYSKLEGYAVSKLANIYHSKFLCDELTGTKVTINSMHPGFVQTNIMNRNVNDMCKRLVNIICAYTSAWFGRSPEDAAKTLVYMAVEPELSEVTGEYFENVSIQTKSLSRSAHNKEQARKMREISFLACKDYLDLPEDIVKIEEVGALQEDNIKKEEEGTQEGFSEAKTETKTDTENSCSHTPTAPCESTLPTKAVEEEAPAAAAAAAAAAATAVAATTAAAAVTEVDAASAEVAETIKAATAESTNVSAPEIRTISELDLPTPPCSFTPSLDAINNKNLVEIEDLSSNVCSSTNENKETVPEAIYKPLILPEITESNEHYPPADVDPNLNCDPTNACSDRTSSSREDSPLITLDDAENSDNLHEEETF